MKYLVIFLVLMGFALTPYLVSNSFAICVINEDWSDAPCYTKRGEDPSLNQMKRWWSQYYEFKGTEWMESKKLELMQAIQNGNLLEWKKEDHDRSHHNVYMYYFLIGDIPNEDGLFAEEYYGVRVLSPQQQSASGIPFSEIHCGIDLILIQKYDDTPACVTSETKLKLIERGWTTLEKHLDKSKFKITGLDIYYHPNEPLSISVVKTGYDMCDDWSAKVIDYSDNSTVWQRESHTLCIVSEPLEIQNFIYQVTNENNQLIISKSGDYLFQIDIGRVHLEKDIAIRQNMSGVSFDRTTYLAYCNKTFEDNEIVKYSSLGFAPSRMVFFVNQNSTAHICIKYTSNLDNEGTLNLEADQKDGSLSFYNGTASKIPVSVTPNLIPLQNGALTVADYSITIPPDERGVYWLNVSQMCERIPIVTSDYPLSDEDIPAIVGVHGCPMIQLDAKLVSYSGVIVQYHDAKPITGR